MTPVFTNSQRNTEKMKDSIIGILNKEMYISVGMELMGMEPAADTLTALMCYREAKAFIGACGADWPLLSAYIQSKCMEYLKNYYPEQDIFKAIEKVINEMK
jgi:hypothetical protein